MSLIRWSPFQSMNPFEDFDKIFEGFPTRALQGFVPEADVIETKDAVEVEVPLAGVDPEKVEISIEDDVLTIRGHMERKTEVEEKNYARREVRHGAFMRTLTLPTQVEGEKASASSDHGMLKIHLPKAKAEKQKVVKVTIKKK